MQSRSLSICAVRDTEMYTNRCTPSQESRTPHGVTMESQTLSICAVRDTEMYTNTCSPSQDVPRTAHMLTYTHPHTPARTHTHPYTPTHTIPLSIYSTLTPPPPPTHASPLRLYQRGSTSTGKGGGGGGKKRSQRDFTTHVLHRGVTATATPAPPATAATRSATAATRSATEFPEAATVAQGLAQQYFDGAVRFDMCVYIFYMHMLYVCIYVCIHMYAYLFICMYVYTYTCVHIYAYVYLCI